MTGLLGLTTSGIGLGHYTIVQASRPAIPLAYVWVEPDGTHLITTITGALSTAISTVTITVTIP